MTGASDPPSGVLEMTSRPKAAAAAALLCLVSALPGAAAVPPPVAGTGGAVVADAPLATQAGIEVLAAGGNAVDSAVATALALAVVWPQAGNLGGGGFAVVRIGGELASLDFRETAPAAATRDMYLDASGQPRPGASLVGSLAAGVPGSPAGYRELHRRYGRLPWAAVVAPAERLAAGFTVDRALHDSIADDQKLLARFPETAALWLPGGAPPAPGTRLAQPDLAATLRAYAERGPEALAGGPIAAAIEAASRRYGGVLTAADLAAYRPAWRQPLRFELAGWQMASMPLPSSGGFILAETAGLLERLGWAKLPRFGADRDHLLAEVWRRAYADRFLLGDPSTTEASLERLLAPERLAKLAAAIDLAHATPSTAVAPGADLGAEPGAGPGAEPSETTHLSVVDGDGDLVALTTTLNGLYGCGLWVPGAGFFLNNEMDDFATAPGKPNLFGLIQGEANAVRPGRRMLSSISPTIAWRGEEAVALGARGGSRIPTNTVAVLLNLLVDGDDLAQAIDRPRIHHQWLPDEIRAEADALSPETRSELERRGHKVVLFHEMARVEAVAFHAGGEVEAAADPRGPGSAAVVNLLPGEAPPLLPRSAPPPTP